MKFAGRDAPQGAAQEPARRRGLLEASESDGTWRHTGVTLFKTVAISALALACWYFLPSFEG